MVIIILVLILALILVLIHMKGNQVIDTRVIILIHIIINQIGISAMR